MENSESFVATQASVPREMPEKRELIKWQLLEVLESTLPQIELQVPEEIDKVNGRSFGTITTTDQNHISPDFLFGRVEIKKVDHGPDPDKSDEYNKPHAQISLHFFTPLDKDLKQLVYTFRDEFLWVVDTSTKPKRQVTFNDRFEGGKSYSAKTKEAILPEDVGLEEKLKLGKGRGNPTSFNYFSLTRTYLLSDETSNAKSTINKNGVLHLNPYPDSINN